MSSLVLVALGIGIIGSIVCVAVAVICSIEDNVRRFVATFISGVVAFTVVILVMFLLKPESDTNACDVAPTGKSEQIARIDQEPNDEETIRSASPSPWLRQHRRYAVM